MFRKSIIWSNLLKISTPLDFNAGNPESKIKKPYCFDLERESLLGWYLKDVSERYEAPEEAWWEVDNVRCEIEKLIAYESGRMLLAHQDMPIIMPKLQKLSMGRAEN
jgi:hypothetical protein